MCVGTLLTQPETEPAGLLELLWYRPSHRLWLCCPSQVVCVVRARCESRTYKIPPHVWAQREGRTHDCWQLSCQQDPTREPRLCARRSADDQRVLVGTVAWPPWVATSLILDRSKLRWIETPCRSCTQARFFERTRRLVARVSGTEGWISAVPGGSAANVRPPAGELSYLSSKSAHSLPTSGGRAMQAASSSSNSLPRRSAP